MHQEQQRERPLALLRRADPLAPEIERNVALLSPVFGAPDRPILGRRSTRAGRLRLRSGRKTGYQPGADAEARPLEDGTACQRVIGWKRVLGHGVLQFAAGRGAI